MNERLVKKLVLVNEIIFSYMVFKTNCPLPQFTITYHYMEKSKSFSQEV